MEFGTLKALAQDFSAAAFPIGRYLTSAAPDTWVSWRDMPLVAVWAVWGLYVVCVSVVCVWAVCEQRRNSGGTA